MPLDLSQFDAVLLDLDGTIYHEDRVLPGAAELVARLEAMQVKYACLSNSVSSPAEVRRRLTGMGIDIAEHHIYTAAAAAAELVLDRYGPQPRVFNLATEGVQQMLEGRVRWVGGPGETCHAVIAGHPLCEYATEPRLRYAVALLRGGAELVGICADRVYPSPRGLELGSGAMCAMLAYAADVRPTFCGKPEAEFFLNLCRRLDVRPERCVLIGDNVESDVAGARRVGMRTILTLTGVAQRGDLGELPADLRPDGVVADLTQLASQPGARMV